MRRLLPALALTLLPQLAAAECDGSFSGFVGELAAEARRKGFEAGQVAAFFEGVRQDQKVLRADRSQGVFRKNFIDFSRSVISQGRIQNGARNAQKYASVLRRAQADYGVSPGVLLAFWALETDYGAVQGDFNTLDALITLAHDCRRPELFRPQIFAALELNRRGDFDPRRTTGAWAGEIGQVQMLPDDILRNGVDGDGDGQVRLKTSSADALMSGAKMLNDLGWRRNEPWLQEVVLPADLDWSTTGLNHELPVSQWAAMGVKGRSAPLASGLSGAVLLPMGRNGPAFIAYPNFRIYFEWNKSFVYVTTAAYFATRLEGAPAYDARSPEPGLSDGQMKTLQQKLASKGYDMGKIDGILGEKTREAVQREQQRLGLPADAWPTEALLEKL